MGNQVTVYTMNNCKFCEAAKTLLKNRGVTYSEVKLAEDDDDQWTALTKRSGMRTMPQIFAGERLIGGFDDLTKVDKRDQLASLK